MRLIIDESIETARGFAKRQGWVQANPNLFIDHENQFVRVTEIQHLSGYTDVDIIYVGQLFWETGQASQNLLTLYCEKLNAKVKGV